jgi:hypothetical protein
MILQLGPGRQWYLQVLYVITSADETTRYRRSAILPAGSIKYRNGTNMRHLGLRSSDFSRSGDAFVASQVFSLTTIVSASVGILVLLVVAAMITTCVIVRKRRSRSGYKQPPYQMRSRSTASAPTARVRSAPKGYQLTRGGTEV